MRCRPEDRRGGPQSRSPTLFRPPLSVSAPLPVPLFLPLFRSPLSVPPFRSPLPDPPLSVQDSAFGALAVGILQKERRDGWSAPKETENGARAVIAGGVCLASHGFGSSRVLDDAVGRRWPELGAKRHVVACAASTHSLSPGGELAAIRRFDHERRTGSQGGSTPVN